MKYFFIVLLSFIMINSVAAQQLTLQDAINLTLKKNYDIQIAKNNVEINTIYNNIGVAGGLPTITGSASDQESIVNINQELNTGTKISRNAAATNALSANVTGSMLLYNGYRVVATKKRLQELQNQSQQLLNLQIQNTIAAVSVKYYDVIRQQSYQKTLSQSINLSKKQLEIIEAKQEVGYANNADLFQAKIDLNTREQDYQSQQLVLIQAQTDLLNIIGVRPDSVVTIKDTIIIDNNLKLETVLNYIAQHPEIQAADEQIKINQLLEKETAAQRAPSLRVNTGVNYGRTQSDAGNLLLNQSYGPFVGLSLGIPIYSGGVIKRQEKVAAINTRSAMVQKESLVNDYQTNTIKTYQSYINNIQQSKVQKDTYELSDSLVYLALQRYELSVSTVLELRAAQQSFEDAGYRFVNFSYAAKIAEIELKRIGGQLGF